MDARTWGHQVRANAASSEAGQLFLEWAQRLVPDLVLGEPGTPVVACSEVATVEGWYSYGRRSPAARASDLVLAIYRVALPQVYGYLLPPLRSRRAG